MYKLFYKYSLYKQLQDGQMSNITLVCRLIHTDVINKWPDKALFCVCVVVKIYLAIPKFHDLSY